MTAEEPLSVTLPHAQGLALTGTLHVPSVPPPWPVMLFVHGSGGLLRWHRRYVDLLAQEGVAVAMLDHFRPRGISRTVTDQEQLSSETMAQDAHAALEAFAGDPRLDASRAGVMGVSKGGSTAWRAALRRFAGPRRFALHVALYPGCETRYHDMATTGARVVIVVGLADTYTGHEPCFDLAAALRAGGSEVEMFGLPAAMHGWDSGAGRWSHPAGVTYAKCRFVEIAPGRWRELSSGVEWDAQDREGRRRAVAGCRCFGVAGGGCPESRARSDAILRAEVRRHLLR